MRRIKVNIGVRVNAAWNSRKYPFNFIHSYANGIRNAFYYLPKGAYHLFLHGFGTGLDFWDGQEGGFPDIYNED